MAINPYPTFTVTSTGSPEAPAFLSPTPITKPEPKIPLSVLFPALTFSSPEQILEHPLLKAPVEKLSEHERGRRGELRFARLGMELFGNIVSNVRVSGWADEADEKGQDVTFIFKDGYPLQKTYGQSKSDKLNADKNRARIRDELGIVDNPQQVRRAIAERKLMIVNTAAIRSDADVKNSIWKDFVLIHEVHGLPQPTRADDPVVVFVA